MLVYACRPFITRDYLIADSCACAFDEIADEDLLEEVIDQATDILCVASGMRITGICTKTLRPVGNSACIPRGFWASVLGPTSAPYGVNVIPLRGPAVDVVSVKIDGTELTSTEYGLIDNEYLFRRDGEWPSSQDLTLVSGADGTFEIVVRFGHDPDFVTRQATAELACELAKEATGKDSNLPKGVISADIQGASVALRDFVGEVDDEGREGLPRVSRFFNFHAPDGRERSGVFSPELTFGWDLVEVEGPSGS